MLTIERSLNIYAAGIPQIISLSQYDDDFQLVFTLYTSEGEFTIPSGTTAEVMGTKVDGNGYSASASISGSTVTVTGNKQMTACAGRNVYEIVLTKSGKRLATVNFILKVERAALDADTIQSETVLKELNAIIDSAETSTQAAAEAAASAAAAAESARTLTIDPTLTQSGQAADAGAVGDEIADLKSDLSEVLSDTIKESLLECFRHVPFLDNGKDYYKNLKDALYPSESEHEWDDDYTWLYRADKNGLLSQNSNVLDMIGINGKFGAESMNGTVLNVSTSYDGTSYGNIYKLIPITNTDAILTAKVRFNKLAKSNSPSGFRMQVSNGTNGAQMFAYYNAIGGTYRISTHEGDVQSIVMNNIELDRWYILSCELSGTKQILKVDDLTVTVNTLSSYANTETRVIVQQPDNASGASDIGDVNVDIAWITYKDNSDADPEWGTDYTWLYRADKNGLLSQNANVSATVGINETLGVESINGSVLNISAPYTGDNYGNIYKLIPLTNTNAVLKAKVKFNKLPASNYPSGLRLQVSNGTKGAQMFAFKHASNGDYRISTHNEEDQVKLTEIQLEKWYVLACEIKPNGTQVLTVDDAVYNINALSSYANTETRVIAQEPDALSGVDVGDLDVDIAWIVYKDNSNQ